MITAAPLSGWLEDKAYAAIKPAAEQALKELLAEHLQPTVETATNIALDMVEAQLPYYVSVASQEGLTRLEAKIPDLVDRALAESRERIRLSPAARMTIFLAASGVAVAAVFSFLGWRKRR